MPIASRALLDARVRWMCAEVAREMRAALVPYVSEITHDGELLMLRVRLDYRPQYRFTITL